MDWLRVSTESTVPRIWYAPYEPLLGLPLPKMSRKELARAKSIPSFRPSRWISERPAQRASSEERT